LPLLGHKKWNVNHENLLTHRVTPLGPISRVSRYLNDTLRLVNPQLGELYHNALLKQINEELCCLYVATTRAKRSLQMIIPSGKDGRNGKTIKSLVAKSQHVVQESLAPGEVCEPGAVLYEIGMKDHWASGLDDRDTQSTQTNSKPVALRVRAPAHIRASALKPAAPSSLHDESARGEIDLGALLNDDAFALEAREHGLCVHTAFEQFDWLGINRDDLSDAMNGKLFADQQITLAMDEVLDAIESPPIARLLSENTWLEDHQSADTTQVHHERPFAVRLNESGEERLVQGRFDRLVLGIRDAQITCVQIVDYKTDRAVQGMDASQLRDYAEKHRVQMDAYRNAIAQMYTLDLDQVESVLVFTRCPGIVNLTTD
jgi:ATP-dependent exoDNAse (exonuclease V) beta subunit